MRNHVREAYRVYCGRRQNEGMPILPFEDWLHVERIENTRRANERLVPAPPPYPEITTGPLTRSGPAVRVEVGNGWQFEGSSAPPSHLDALSALIECMRPSAQDTLAALERRGWAVVRRG